MSEREASRRGTPRTGKKTAEPGKKIAESAKKIVGAGKQGAGTRAGTSGTGAAPGIRKQEWKPGNMLYPLPAIMVSCGRKGEKPNIITLAWTGTVCSDPVMVSISVRKERYSYDIIRETGEFVINLTTEKLAYATDYCGVRSGRDHDKFREMKLTASPASKLSCPIIAESPVNIECKVREVIPLGSHDMFLADVVAVDVSEEYMDENGKFDLNGTDLMVYSHGEYFKLGRKIGQFGYSVKKKK